MTEILSPLAGKIFEINIKAGEIVSEDDEVMIIEAMKMETAVYGENGTVKEILVKVGDQVEEEQVLAIVE